MGRRYEPFRGAKVSSACTIGHHPSRDAQGCAGLHEVGDVAYKQGPTHHRIANRRRAHMG